MEMYTLKKFEKDMEVFSPRQHQDILTYLAHLKANGWIIEDVKLYVETKKQLVQEQQKTYEKVSKKYTDMLINCPDCGTLMYILPVNTDLSTQTGDDSKSVWLCQNNNCMNSIYNKETIEELKKEG